VIEHDMPLITGISDRMIALELGHPIVEGTPQEVTTDPRVVSSYLGGDPAAINRSGASTAKTKAPRRKKAASKTAVSGNGAAADTVTSAPEASPRGSSPPARRRTPLVASSKDKA
jgi:ABC-type glutathione transport system ATPase component